MRKKAIWSVFLCLLLFAGCNNSGKMSRVSNSAQHTPTNSSSRTITCTEYESKNIPFKYVYAGFAAQTNTLQANSNNGFPVGTVVISTEKEWKEFKSKYLCNERGSIKYADMAYRFSKPADFSEESIIYNSELSTKPDVFAWAYQIDKIVLENNQPKVIPKEFDNDLKITTTCYNALERYIILVTVNKADLPK